MGGSIKRTIARWDLEILYAKGYDPEIVGYEEDSGKGASWIVLYPYRTKFQATVDRLLGDERWDAQ